VEFKGSGQVGKTVGHPEVKRWIHKEIPQHDMLWKTDHDLRLDGLVDSSQASPELVEGLVLPTLGSLPLT